MAGAMAVFVVALGSCAGAQASILDAKGPQVRVRLLDAASGRPVTSTAVRLYSDNGIRCVTRPCPTNGMEWRGASDGDGYVVIPTRVLQFETSVGTKRHFGDLVEDSAPDGNGGWVVELTPQPADKEYYQREFKLIDARTNRAIANTPARVEFQESDTSGIWSTTTSPLGYIFVPFEMPVENTWIVLPGYRRTQLRFAYAERKTKVERQ